MLVNLMVRFVGLGCNMATTDEFEVTRSGPDCSKLTTSLVNVSLKFQMLISQIHQYFLLKKCEKLLQCKSVQKLFTFFQQKISVYLGIKL